MLSKGHRYNLGSWLRDQTQQAVNKAFNTDGKFDFTKAAGSIGGTLGDVGSMFSAANQLMNITDTTDDRALIGDAYNKEFSGNSTDSLLSQWDSTNLLDNQYNVEDIRGYSDGEMGGKILGSIGQGAMAGAKYGPWGAIGGALLGGLTSGIGAAIGTDEARKEVQELELLQQIANRKTVDSFNSQANIMNQNNFNNREILADGGKIHIKPSKKGTFTAAAKKRGMGVQEFARKVLANKEDYSSAMVKKANFAHVFGGRNYSNGGYLEGNIYEVDEDELNKIISLGYKFEFV